MRKTPGLRDGNNNPVDYPGQAMTERSTTRLAAGERRDQLLGAARETFGRNGFTNTSMNDVANVAGVTKPVLYQHFDSKHDLFHEVLATTAQALVKRMQRSVASAQSGREKVELAASEYIGFFAEEPSRFNVLFGDGVRSEKRFRSELKTLEDTFVFSVAEHIAIDGFDPPERLLLAQGLSGMFEAATRRWMHDGSLETEPAARLLAAFAWRGLRGLEPAP